MQDESRPIATKCYSLVLAAVQQTPMAKSRYCNTPIPKRLISTLPLLPTLSIVQVHMCNLQNIA